MRKRKKEWKTKSKQIDEGAGSVRGHCGRKGVKCEVIGEMLVLEGYGRGGKRGVGLKMDG